MPVFVWEGRTATGIPQRGEMEAPNELALRTFLTHRGIIPTKVSKKPKEITLPFLKKRVKKRDLLVFTQQLSAMIDAGLPLAQALEILVIQTQNQAFKEIIRKVKEDVEGGFTFAQALRRHPRVFDRLYVHMVHAGEESGNLDTMLKRLADHIEKVENLKRKIRGALIYPGIILAVAIVVTTVLLVYVIPTFDKLFRDVGASLPLPTQIVIGTSKAVKTSFPFLVLALLAFVVALRFYYRTERGRLHIDSLLLKVPVIGILLQKVSIARFARTLATLIGSGVPALQALEIVASTAGNARVEKAIREAREDLREGESLAPPLQESGVFPPMVTHMVAVGEATGNLDGMLRKVADFYEADVDHAVANLSSMIEPVLIVFLGVLIGGLVISMYLPIFKLASAF